MRFGKHWFIGVSALILLLALAPGLASAADLQIRIKKDIAIGDYDDTQFMHSVGVLKAGSVISIPQKYVAKDPKTKQPSVSLTLDKWTKATLADNGGPGKFKFSADNEEEFFPVKIKTAAPGSSLGPADQKFLALRSLARTGNIEIVSPVPQNQPKPAASTSTSRPMQTPTSRPMQARAACTDCATEIPGTAVAHATAAGILKTVDAVEPGPAPSTPLARSALSVLAPTATRKKSGRGTYPMAEACSNIISPDGKIGPWGKDIVEVMLQPKYRTSFLEYQSLGSFCPKYKDLSDADKVRAWLWFWAALADAESSCRPNAFHATHSRKGTRINPRAGHGLWAMERDGNIRQSRGHACFNIQTVRGQASCTIDILKETQFDRGYTAYYKSGSYWGPIRRAQTDLIPYMKRLKGCF